MIKSAFLIVATCCSLQLFSQEKFPDGKIIPDWFYKNEKTDINGLGKSLLITDYGVVNDSTLLQTEKIQAVIDLASIMEAESLLYLKVLILVVRCSLSREHTCIWKRKLY